MIRASVSQEGMVDVSRRTCEGIGCIYEAKYGNPEQRTKRFCARHKLEGMLTLEDMVRGANISLLDTFTPAVLLNIYINIE